jgi:2-polyprenyl-3-methyl-5-hydroxy-6-metoxy-1,4-benzoquinol methylase
MTVELDPKQVETGLLIDYLGVLSGKRIFEIGCGDGRLTWRYAGEASQVVGIDPKEGAITKAIEALPEGLKNKVVFETCTLEEYASQHPEVIQKEKFDLVLLAWSL